MTINLLPQHPMPSHPRRRDGKAPLPAPEDRARLRRAWRLTEEQVAAAFGVTTATVRSWESGRTTPTGLRRAAYAAFLGGLSQGLAATAAPPPAVHPTRRTSRRRPGLPVERPQARPALQPYDPPVRMTPEIVPEGSPGAVALPVGAGADPVAPARRRRLRVLAGAACAWTVFLHLMTTSPPPHL
ncbi:helix-turn-helix domain-containing protein [Streptomyces sp. cg40]|uniref:helix-turn-helix domain-containing protein n=1 Tax=Streptomyces sp. cg40 TaxID=3419764 RepID=UPI003D06C6CB